MTSDFDATATRPTLHELETPMERQCIVDRDESIDFEDLDIALAPSGGSDAVGGLACAAGRAIVIIYTVSRER